MAEIVVPKRVIVNFTQKCALNCEWCYVPFDRQPIRLEVVTSIIERVADLGFESITFGGGDPFQFRHLDQVVKKTKELGLFVHIDTHAKTLRETSANEVILGNCVDLIGLPLDGPSSFVHDLMRSSNGHFELILRKLEWLRTQNVDIKINTIVSAVNVDDLVELSKLISYLSPNRWSIYQYWPVGPAARATLKHELDEVEFSQAISKIDMQLIRNKTIVEVNSAESRRRTYPILNHTGEIQYHTEYPSNEFFRSGCIFDRDAVENIKYICGGERDQAVSRYIKITEQH